LAGVRYGIVGSRRFADPDAVESYVESLPSASSIVTGSASGVDAAATRAARRRGLHVGVVGASFEELRDPAVAAARNQRLIDQCDVLVAFWDASSTGTRMTVERALDAGKEVHVFVRR
jgi:predicted Rossmann fold nucleotide-binding protein DprA/Smf involved in DNA uptake